MLNTGHGHPRVIVAGRAQLAKTVLFTTGAEAVENAVKIARAATGRTAVIAFAGGFHGRTLLTMALTGKVTPYKRGLGPTAPDIYHLPLPGEEGAVTVNYSLGALCQIFTMDVEPERVAAMIIEPVQGEGGFRAAPLALLRALRAICDEHGILLIADPRRHRRLPCGLCLYPGYGARLRHPESARLRNGQPQYRADIERGHSVRRRQEIWLWPGRVELWPGRIPEFKGRVRRDLTEESCSKTFCLHCQNVLALWESEDLDDRPSSRH